MNTMFYCVGRRATVYVFTPLVGDTVTDLAEQAAADYWKRTGIASSHRPLHITLLDENGRVHGAFSVVVAQPPTYDATPRTD